MVRPSRPAPLMLEEPFMLFSGSLSGGLSTNSHSSSSSSSSSSHAHSHSVDRDDPSTTQDPCTILSPCSLPSSSTKDLSSSATGGLILAPPLGASPRHGLDATNGGLPSVRGAAVVTPTQRSSSSSSSSSTTTTRKARNLTLGVVVEEQEAVLRQQTGAQQQQQQQQQQLQGGDNDSNSNSTSPRLPPSGRTPSFAFFKRSNSASCSLVGMNNGGGSIPSTPSPSSSHSASGLKIKKKRGFPHLILTPKGNSSHPSSMLPPRALPSLSSVANSNNNSSSNSSTSSSSTSIKQVSSPASLISLMSRLRRRATVPLDDRSSCPPSLPPSSSGSSTATTTPDTSNSSSTGSSRKLMIETGPRSASATGPMALSTMDFQYDGSKILDYLYVGGEHIPSQDALAETFNITHIVNTTMKDYYPHHPFGQGDYCQLYLLDALSEELTSEKLEAAFQMVERARAGGHACLVHCRNGMSRSTSVVIAYLMRYYKMPLLEAFNFVRERRPCTSPNPSFMRQLARLEREWNGGGGNSLDVEHYADDRFASIRELAVKDEEEEEEGGKEGGVVVLQEVEEEGGFEEEEEGEEGRDVGCPLSSGDECSARGSVGGEEEEEVEEEGEEEEGRGRKGAE